MGTLSQNGYGDTNLFVRLFLYMNFLDPLFPLGFSSCRTPHRQPDALNAHKPGTTISAQPASQPPAPIHVNSGPGPHIHAQSGTAGVASPCVSMCRLWSGRSVGRHVPILRYISPASTHVGARPPGSNTISQCGQTLALLLGCG
jgi:hypothetical protein